MRALVRTPVPGLFAAVLLLSLPGLGRTAAPDPAALDAVIESMVKAFQVPGAAVAIVQDDKVVYLKGFGIRRLGSDERVTPDTVFAIGSCTKAFTATALAALVGEGKLGWDDPVRKHLEYFRLPDPLADREVTVRDLLCHRTGMPRHDILWYETDDLAAEVIRRYGLAKSSSSFRSTWEYANIPYTAAGEVLARLEKSDWPSVMRRRFFSPLRMTSANCTAKEAQAALDHATPHLKAPDGPIRPIPWADLGNAAAAGAINASARDMANWLRFQLADGVFEGQRLVPAAAFKETRTPQAVVRQEGRWKVFYPEKTTNLLNYGLGWFVHDYRGRLAVSHGGTIDGFRTQTVLAPKDRCGVIVVGNLTPSQFPEALTKALLDRLFGLPPEDWTAFYREQEQKQQDDRTATLKKREAARKPNTKPSRELSAYAGNYEEPAYGRAEVAVDGANLTLRWGRLTFRLEHFHFDTFAGKLTAPASEVGRFAQSPVDVVFRLGPNGEFEGLRLFDQEFRRVKPAKPAGVAQAQPAGVAQAQPAAPFDVLIHSGTVYDSSGQPPRRADVALRGDRIAAVGDLSGAAAKAVVNANGLAVAPGFINMLSWSTESLLADGKSQSEIRQGVTTQVMGEGWSWGPVNDAIRERVKREQTDIKYEIEWRTLSEYLYFLERRGVAPNVASFLGATTVREYVLGLGNVKPSAEQMDQMRRLVEAEMKDGALGIATALEYAPAYYADAEELIELCKVAARYQGKYIAHMRREGPRLLEGIDEVIRIAREAKLPAEVYHFKAAGRENWPKMDAAVAKIEAARREGLKVTANMYCYTAGATGLDACIPPWAQDGGEVAMRRRLRDPEARRRIADDLRNRTDWPNFYRNAGSPENVLLVGFKKEYLKPLQGKTLAEVAKLRNKDPIETMMDLLAEDESRITTVYFLMSEENVRKLIPLPWVSFGSDEASQAPEGVFLKAMPHPRAYGNFARLLGKYVRDEKVLPLEEAIRKLTSLPATNLGLDRRGLLREGYFADVAVFDPRTIADRATYEKPHQYAVGMKHVFVNGVQVLTDGEHTGATPGRALWGPGRVER